MDKSKSAASPNELASSTEGELAQSMTNSKKQKKENVINMDEEQADVSPDNRFIRYASEVGRGSFKTVYKALDSSNGIKVAWSELNVFLCVF